MSFFLQSWQLFVRLQCWLRAVHEERYCWIYNSAFWNWRARRRYLSKEQNLRCCYVPNTHRSRKRSYSFNKGTIYVSLSKTARVAFLGIPENQEIYFVRKTLGICVHQPASWNFQEFNRFVPRGSLKKIIEGNNQNVLGQNFAKWCFWNDQFFI